MSDAKAKLLEMVEMQRTEQERFRKAIARANARGRLETAALRIGSKLLAEVDPDWDDTQELEAAAVEYARCHGGKP